MSPLPDLALAILIRAIKDWRRYGHIAERPSTCDNWAAYLAYLHAKDRGFDSPHDELKAFFDSDWFEELCIVAGLDADAVGWRVEI